MGKIFHFTDLCYINITFAIFFSTGKMMNILSDFGKDEQVKKVALKTGISGKNSTISALQIISFLVSLVILIIIIIISSFFLPFEGEMLASNPLENRGLMQGFNKFWSIAADPIKLGGCNTSGAIRSLSLGGFLESRILVLKERISLSYEKNWGEAF